MPELREFRVHAEDGRQFTLQSYREDVDVSDNDDPGATVPGMRTLTLKETGGPVNTTGLRLTCDDHNAP